MTTIGVVGTGTWGSTVASLLARAGESVVLWGRRREQVEGLLELRRHPRLGDHGLPRELVISADDQALAACSLWIWAVPVQHSRGVAQQLAPQLAPGAGIVSLSKGLERETLARPSTILAAALPPHRFTCLSGPSHAEEVVAGSPAGLVLAGDAQLAALVQPILKRTQLRVYTSSDALGVELAGALKNVIAIAAGCCDAMGLGDNVKATLVTRGLAEIRRLGRALGCQDATFAGLAGIGDLLTTCYSQHSRNRGLGQAIGKGVSLDDFCQSTGTVPEGAWTSAAAADLATQSGVEMPIASQVASVLWHDTPVRDAMARLLARDAGHEDV